MTPIKSLQLAALGCVLVLGACGGAPEDDAPAPADPATAQQRARALGYDAEVLTPSVTIPSTLTGPPYRATLLQAAVNCTGGSTVQPTVCERPISHRIELVGPSR